MRVDEQLAQRFVCSKCRNRGGATRRIAATGTGLTKILDIQHNRFVGVSCNHCGYTDFFDLKILEGKGSVGTILDVIFGT